MLAKQLTLQSNLYANKLFDTHQASNCQQLTKLLYYKHASSTIKLLSSSMQK